ncbi:GNAT family N-acetyltransferase [Paracoccaceae bacterium GXU_MW_L88]
MQIDLSRFETRIAQNKAEITASQALRYRVFVEEMGADTVNADHESRLEVDQWDDVFDHLLLIDHEKGGEIVGVYRLLRRNVAEQGPGFYSDDEYDLSRLADWPGEILELGRSCVAPEYRGGMALQMLWDGLADYVLEHEISLLFGVASFPGTDVDALAQPLANLHYNHAAPEALRVPARPAQRLEMDRVAKDQLDRAAALRATPSLIKSYLRLGGVVGDGAWIDHDFNTTDVCILVETGPMKDRYLKSREARAKRGAA